MAILLRISRHPSILFAQIRPGKNGQPIRVIKFRTMNERKSVIGNLLPDAERLTGLGKFLRKTSIDELPQLFNVLKGEMSLVGPRPLLTEYLPLYSLEQVRRHGVKPGITGWAQVNGRNAISWKEKFILDVWYVNRQSFLLDLKILFMTVGKVFRGLNISYPGNATTRRFDGTN